MNDQQDTTVASVPEGRDLARRALDEAGYEESGDMGPFWAALSKAQAGFAPIVKSKTVTVYPKKKPDGYQPPSYTFNYAPLDEVLKATLPALAANGLALIQPFFGLESKRLKVKLGHSSGATLSVTVAVPPAADVQALGSSLTYLRRYAVSCLLGVASEEDDDGNASAGNESQPAQRAPKQEPAKTRPSPPEHSPSQSTISKDLKAKIWEVAKQAGFNAQDLRAFCSRFEVDLEHATQEQGQKVLAELEGMKVMR